MPFIIIPTRRRGRTTSPTTLAVLMVGLGLFFVAMGISKIGKGPDCDGREMQQGDVCVYRDQASGRFDHSNDFDEEASSDRTDLLVGLGLGALLIVGAPFAYNGAQRRKDKQHREQMARRAAERAAQAPLSGGVPVGTAYSQQVARHAAAMAQPLPPPPGSYPPPPPPAAPRPQPTLHHEA